MHVCVSLHACVCVCVQHGVTTVPFTDKHLTHRKAWMTVLVDGLCYGLTFENGGQITNVSYDSVFYQFNVSSHH